MSYDICIKAAGVDVLAYREVGSYTGDWYALTPAGFYSGNYGSCSGCDWREAEQSKAGWDRADSIAHEIDASIGRKILADKPQTLSEFIAGLSEYADDRGETIAWAKALPPTHAAVQATTDPDGEKEGR